jgi:TonB family protein
MDNPSLPTDASAAPGQSTSPIARRDSKHVLAQLRTSIDDSNLSLGAKLDYIVQAAQMVVSADGAAIAMQRDNLVVCQARSGDMAPELGSELDADSGISGQCLRTGETVCCHDTDNDARVDAEVCRSLGLRSLAVVPVGTKSAVSGVLEVFSALPNAFDDAQMELLKEMAELVVAAQCRATELDVEVASEKPVDIEKPAPTRKRSLILAAVAVLVLLGCLVFRVKSNTHPLYAAAPQPVASPSASAVAHRSSAGVLKLNPLPVDDPQSAMPNMPSPLAKGSKAERDSLIGDVTVRKFAPGPASNPNTSIIVPNGRSRPPAQNPNPAVETAPALSAFSTGIETVPGGLLFAAPNMPQAPRQLSQGSSGGTVEHQVDPIYPTEGLVPKEGRVLLEAAVAEDGTVHDLKVIKGNPLLARAAIQAVAQWRYRPFMLDGQPIRRTIEITLVFKRP